MKNNKSFTLGFFLVALIFISFGCAGGTTKQPEDTAAPSVALTEAPVEPIQEETIETEPTAVEQEPALAPTPDLQPEPLIVTKSGFGQDGVSAGFGFVIENPNMGIAFENTHYEVFAYDDNGAEIGAAFGYIYLLLPEQTLGIGGSLLVISEETISRVEVQINPGEPKIPDSFPAFSVESAYFLPGEYSSLVTGIIINLHEVEYQTISVSAIAYDGSGNITGGGYTFKSYIQANKKGGVEVPLTFAGEVAKVELYAYTSATSLLYPEIVIPEGAEDLQVLTTGFGQLKNESGFGMYILNPNLEYAIETSRYELISYAADGKVLDIDEGLIMLMLPGQTIGFGGDLYIEKGLEIDHIEVQLKTGEYKASDTLPFLFSENVVFKPDSHYPKVSGDIVNPYDVPLTGLMVYAIALDENGNIIGGGYSLGLSISANGKESLEVSVAVEGTPASVELYAIFSSLSDIE